MLSTYKEPVAGWTDNLCEYKFFIDKIIKETDHQLKTLYYGDERKEEVNTSIILLMNF